MKKKQIASKCLKWGSALLSIIAFCMMFAIQLKHTLGTGIATQFTFEQVLFGANGINKSISGFVGYLMILIGGLTIGAMGCVLQNKKKINFLITMLSAFVCAIGIFLVFNIGSAFITNNPSFSKGSLTLGYGPIAGGLFGVLATICGFVAVSLDYNE